MGDTRTVKKQNLFFVHTLVFLTGFAIGGLFFPTSGLSNSVIRNHCYDDAPIPIPRQNSGNMFDEMNTYLYQIANKKVATKLKKKYRLGSVAQTSGGLRDSDRTLLAGLYQNASSVFEYGLG